MRCFYLIVTSILVSLFFVNSSKEIELEKEVYWLYVSGFEGYLLVDDEYNLSVDKEKLSYDLSEYGNVKIVGSNNIHFYIEGYFPLHYKKEYCFYLEENK